MKPIILLPHPSLQSYIQNYLYFEIGAEDQWTGINTSPTALPVMSFAMETDHCVFKEFGRCEPLMFGGQLTEFTQMHVHGRKRMFIVFFHPVGAYQMLGIPQKDLNGMMLSMSDLLGAVARVLKEKMLEQATAEGMQHVVENFFLKRLLQQKENDAAKRLASAIDQIKKDSHYNDVIKRTCRLHGYSISRLERHMREMAGIGPKMLQRIVRFNKVLEHLRRYQPPCHWAQIARQFGYYDQTHLIKEFAWFFGTTPGKVDTLSSKLQLSLNSSGEEETGKSIFRVYE